MSKKEAIYNIINQIESCIEVQESFLAQLEPSTDGLIHTTRLLSYLITELRGINDKDE